MLILIIMPRWHISCCFRSSDAAVEQMAAVALQHSSIARHLEPDTSRISRTLQAGEFAS